MATILSILPTLGFYGKERSNAEVYRLLQRHGYSVVVVLEKTAPAELNHHLAGLDLHRIPMPLSDGSTGRFLCRFLAYLRSNIALARIIFKTKPDLLFMNTEGAYYGFFATILLFQLKIVYRIGDEPLFPRMSHSWIYRRIWTWMVCKQTHTIVSISNFIKNKVSQTGRSNLRDRVIYNIPPSRNRTPSDTLCLPMKPSMTFGYLGQIVPQKGVLEFLDAAEYLLERDEALRFVVAGDLNYLPTYGEKVMSRASAISKRDRICFLGKIDEVDSFFDAIDILCVPSLKEEPLGNVIVEAKLHSKPCIIFHSGGMPELIRHEMDGYICKSKDAHSLAEGMEYYRSNPSKSRQHGENAACSLAEFRITPQQFEQDWLSVFDKALLPTK